MQLCHSLKNDIQTSHIPIILLTARLSVQDEKEGYEEGADAYISKPFDFDILLTRIRKLIEQQSKRKEDFHNRIEVTPSNLTITSLDEKLIQRALTYVEKNIDNSDYSIEQLADEIGMTRMSLYRKIKALTGLTPTEFVRSIRLKRAAQLLISSGLSVKEISFMTGFNDTRYFTKCFKRMFNLLPSNYANINNK